MLSDSEIVELTDKSIFDRVEIEALLEHAKFVSYARGECIIEKNALDNDLYLIIDGRVRAYSVSSEGRELTFGYQSAGSFFGEMALLSGHPRSASVEADEPAQLACISAEGFELAAAAQPNIRRQLMTGLIERVGELTDRVESQAFLNVYGRIRVLLLCDTEASNEPQIRPKMTQQSIANHVGASREMVSKIMKQLRQGGYIEVGRDSITINKNLPVGW